MSRNLTIIAGVCLFLLLVILNTPFTASISGPLSADTKIAPETKGVDREKTAGFELSSISLIPGLENQDPRTIEFVAHRKYPWTILEVNDGYTEEYAAAHLLVNFEYLEKDAREAAQTIIGHPESDYEIEFISDTIALVSWEYAGIQGFDQHHQYLVDLFPGATVDKDFINHKMAWTEGETLDDSYDRIGLKWLYESELNADGFVVAVIDSGIEQSHPELAGRIYTNASDPLDGFDNDGNQFIDDVNGWDFLDNDNDPEDIEGHGTAVSGIIAADGANGYGVAGYAPGSKILPLKFLDSNGEGFDSDAIKAINYTSSKGVKVINTSWGREGVSTATLESAISNFISQGGIFITSAGNDSRNLANVSYSPACLDLDGMIVVAGCDKDFLGKHPSSNFGQVDVDVFAPYTVTKLNIGGVPEGQGMGTSYSSPIIASVAAVIWKNFPYLTADEVIERVLFTCACIPENWYLIKYPGYPDFSRAINDTRPTVPAITGHTVTRDPAHINEDFKVIFSVDANQPYKITSDNAQYDQFSGNEFTLIGDLNKTEHTFTVHGLIGETSYGPVYLNVTSSPPYLAEDFPSHIEMTNYPLYFEIPMSPFIRGDRSIVYDTGLGARGYFSSDGSYHTTKAIQYTGKHTLRFKNEWGSAEGIITFTMGHRVLPEMLPLEATPYAMGNQFIYFNAGEITIFDGLKFNSTYVGDTMGSNPDWIRYLGGYIFIYVYRLGLFVSADGQNWRSYPELRQLGEPIGVFRGLHAFNMGSYISLFDVYTGAQEIISNPEGVNRFDMLITDGNLICAISGTDLWKYQDPDGWKIVRNNLPDYHYSFYCQGAFLFIQRYEFNTDTYILYSIDGDNWQERPMHYVPEAPSSAIFEYSGFPCVEIDNLVYGFDFAEDSWVKLLDLDLEIIYQAGLTQPIRRRQNRFINGNFYVQFPEIDSVAVTTEGIYAYVDNKLYISQDFVDWKFISDPPTGLVFSRDPVNYRGRGLVLESNYGSLPAYPGEDIELLSPSFYNLFPFAGFTGEEHFFRTTELGKFRYYAEHELISTDQFGLLHAAQSPSGDGFLYDFNLGWMFTNAAIFPTVYSYTLGTWVDYAAYSDAISN